ncbi:MAG: hypothetical protein DMG74_04675 [Acidobacteria bacterium]|nr:MAG: hypothetical protein DMG74_04675 [Acidobacteriota bacterium]
MGDYPRRFQLSGRGSPRAIFNILAESKVGYGSLNQRNQAGKKLRDRYKVLRIWVVKGTPAEGPRCLIDEIMN